MRVSFTFGCESVSICPRIGFTGIGRRPAKPPDHAPAAMTRCFPSTVPIEVRT